MGEYHPALDEKGRVAIPVRLRKAFGENAVINKLIITHGFDKCIMAFREEDWSEFVANRLQPLSQADPMNRMRLRFLMGGASECELDKQGRIIVPAYLKEYAEIDNEVTMLGLCNKIEIWGSEVYNRYRPDGEALNAFAKDLGF
ncbi:MAG TPA: division/cell wall cluster transcriptional repressor MraZ [Spirochaetota bacterium]|nr:division/cell wall cluster transcriptional repressor MraZ [Spirochaetota bacterium]